MSEKFVSKVLDEKGMEFDVQRVVQVGSGGTSGMVTDGKGKVKCTLVQALRLCTGRTARSSRGIREQRYSRGIALPFHDLGTRGGEGLASRTGRSLPPGKTRYPLYRRLGGPQGRSGQVRKISLPSVFDPRTVQPVASRYTGYTTWPTWLPMTRRRLDWITWGLRQLKERGNFSIFHRYPRIRSFYEYDD